MITATCSHCGAKCKVGAENVGKRLRCPRCKEIVTIPAAAAREEAQVARAPAPRRGEPQTGDSSDQEPELAAGTFPDHWGEPLPDDADFFEPPPPEIGEVLSGYTDLRKGMRPWPTWVTLSAPFVGGALGAAFGVWAAGHAATMSPLWRILFPTILGLLGAFVLFSIFAFTHSLSYVGKEGAVWYDCFWTRNVLSFKRLLRFQDVVNLWASTTLHIYTDGKYRNTSFQFQWYDARNHIHFTLWGSHNSKEGKPPVENQYAMAKAAERAWTRHLLPRALQQLEDDGHVQFDLWKLVGTAWIRLHKDGITFKLQGQPARLPAACIAGAHLEKGILTFRVSRVSAGIPNVKSTYQVVLNDVANNQLFLCLLGELYTFQID
jgi:hypothetical protein